MNCRKCQCDHYCCQLRVKLSWLNQIMIRLKGYKNFSERIPERVIKLNGKYCYFLKNKKCQIYSIRPQPCRDFPFEKLKNCQKIYFPWKKHQDKIKELINKPVKRNDFQTKVFQLTRQIPMGKVSTYQEIGKKLRIKAYQAVGQALNQSPGMPECPCHRVISSDGSLGGFAWGIENKIKLLESEGVEVKNHKVDLKKFKTKIKKR